MLLLKIHSVYNNAVATFTGDRDVNSYLTTLAGTVDENGKKLLGILERGKYSANGNWTKIHLV